jgi:hypothetical protein
MDEKEFDYSGVAHFGPSIYYGSIEPRYLAEIHRLNNNIEDLLANFKDIKYKMGEKIFVSTRITRLDFSHKYGGLVELDHLGKIRMTLDGKPKKYIGTLVKRLKTERKESSELRDDDKLERPKCVDICIKTGADAYILKRKSDSYQWQRQWSIPEDHIILGIERMDPEEEQAKMPIVTTTYFWNEISFYKRD